MKLFIIGVVMFVSIVVGGLLILSEKAYCYNCSSVGQECVFNLDCGIGCSCYKGSGHIYGVCGDR